MRLHHRTITVALACAVLAIAVIPAAAQSPVVEFPSFAGAVVLEYNVIHHMLAQPDPEPLMRIFADGRVRVHYPVYMAKAGDYEVRLSTAELHGLFDELATSGIMDFDAEAVSAEKERVEAVERAGGVLHHVSDVSETVIDIRVKSYRPAGSAAAIADFEKSIRWPNIHTDAQRFKGIAEVQALARAVERLRAIINRSDLSRVR